MNSRQIEAVNLLDRIEPLINDSDIKNQIKEYISNYVNEDNETEIIDSCLAVGMNITKLPVILLEFNNL